MGQRLICISEKIIKYVLGEVIIRFLLCYLLALVLYLLLPNITNQNIKSIMVNILSTLISLPLVFIAYDLYKKALVYKSSKLVSRVLDKSINDIFLRFTYFSTYFYHEMDHNPQYNIYNLNAELERDVNNIFESISNNIFHGYFIFSTFDNFDEDIENVINSNLVLKYLNVREIAILYKFINNYKELKALFSLVSQDNFIKYSPLQQIKIEQSQSATSSNSNEQFYDIIFLEGEKRVPYFASKYKLFDEEALLMKYKLSGSKSKEISDLLFKLYQDVNKWKRLKSIKELKFESGVISSNRLYVDADITINMHMKDNVSFSGKF